MSKWFQKCRCKLQLLRGKSGPPQIFWGVPRKSKDEHWRTLSNYSLVVTEPIWMLWFWRIIWAWSINAEILLHFYFTNTREELWCSNTVLSLSLKKWSWGPFSSEKVTISRNKALKVEKLYSAESRWFRF